MIMLLIFGGSEITPTSEEVNTTLGYGIFGYDSPQSGGQVLNGSGYHIGERVHPPRRGRRRR